MASSPQSSSRRPIVFRSSKSSLSARASLSAMSLAASEKTTNGGSQHDELSCLADGDSSVVAVTRRRERSMRSKLLHSSLRPLRPRLVKGAAPKQELSPELRGPEVVFEHCNVRQRQAGGLRVYDINQRSHHTADYFIPAQVHDLRNELTPVRSKDTPTNNHMLRLLQSHETSNTIGRDFAKPQNIKRPRHRQIYYFAGGGFQASPSDHHWRFCADLAHRLTAEFDQPTTVSIVSHPLAPRDRLPAAFAALERFYETVLPASPPSSPVLRPADSNGNGTDTGTGTGNNKPADSPLGNGSPVSIKPATSRPRILRNEEDVIFAGDSSGANIALSLVLHMLAKDPHVLVPTQILLVSPVVDMTHSNAAQPDVSRRDPLMTLDYVRDVARTWCGDEVKLEDPRASPLLADFTDFAARGIRVHGVVAGDDVLAPDTLRLIEKCRTAGVRGSWLVWERMMHAFPLAPHYGMPESREAMDWILGVLSVKLPADT